jgi:hypothetical protein
MQTRQLRLLIPKLSLGFLVGVKSVIKNCLLARNLHGNEVIISLSMNSEKRFVFEYIFAS